MRVAGETELYSRTVVDPPTVWPGPPGPQSCARADSVARALERPASGFSACRECCVSICLVDGCGGGLLVAFRYKFTELRIYGSTPLPPRPAARP